MCLVLVLQNCPIVCIIIIWLDECGCVKCSHVLRNAKEAVVHIRSTVYACNTLHDQRVAVLVKVWYTESALSDSFLSFEGNLWFPLKKKRQCNHSLRAGIHCFTSLVHSTVSHTSHNANHHEYLTDTASWIQCPEKQITHSHDALLLTTTENNNKNGLKLWVFFKTPTLFDNFTLQQK